MDRTSLLGESMIRSSYKDLTGVLGWPGFVTLILVLYVLSIGPAAAVAKKHLNNRAIVTSFWVVYYPVLCAYENPFVRDALDAYGNLWGLQ